METLWKIVAINAVQCLVGYSVHFKVSGLEWLVANTRWSTTVANTLTHDGYGSVNITARRCKCKRVCDSCRSPLSRVKYDPLFHSGHNGGDRTVKVGHEINSHIPLQTVWKRKLARLLSSWLVAGRNRNCLISLRRQVNATVEDCM